ncbi:MAG: outer membrane protein transport protein [Kofleriaceae bacterium]|nr:outer membrane protein transport protein [Kofleriaceae bacterium]
MRNQLLSVTLLGLAASAAQVSVAHANGFVLFDHGAAATGRGNAVTATISDGSAIVHNPAGIAIGTGTNILVGGSMILPSGSFTPEGSDTTIDSTAPNSYTPQLYITSKVHDAVAVGVGVHAPFGSKISWSADVPFADEVRSQALRAIFISPIVGVDLNRWVPGLRIGGGPDLVPSDVELTQDIYFGDATGSARLGGKAFGIGGRVGVMYAPAAAPKWSFGAMYRSNIKLDFTGNGDFDADQPYRGQLPPDGEITTSITLPQQLSGGVAFRPINALEVEANAVWTDWKQVDKIDIVLPDGSITTSPRDYISKVTLRTGAAYTFPKQPNVTVRAGYMYDPTPVPDTRLTGALPDMNRHDITAGATYRQGRYHVDFGTLLVLPGSRKTSATPGEPNYKGTFELTALVLSASFGVHFGK